MDVIGLTLSVIITPFTKWNGLIRLNSTLFDRTFSYTRSRYLVTIFEMKIKYKPFYTCHTITELKSTILISDLINQLLIWLLTIRAIITIRPIITIRAIITIIRAIITIRVIIKNDNNNSNYNNQGNHAIRILS